MKKLLTLAAVAALAMGVVACNKPAGEENAQPMDQSTEMKQDGAAPAEPANNPGQTEKKAGAMDNTSPSTTDTTAAAAPSNEQGATSSDTQTQ